MFFTKQLLNLTSANIGGIVVFVICRLSKDDILLYLSLFNRTGKAGYKPSLGAGNHHYHPCQSVIVVVDCLKHMIPENVRGKTGSVPFYTALITDNIDLLVYITHLPCV